MSGFKNAVADSVKDKVGFGKSHDDEVSAESTLAEHSQGTATQQSPHINFDELEEFDEDLPYETGTKPTSSASSTSNAAQEEQAESISTPLQPQAQNFAPAALGAKPIKPRAEEVDPNLPPMPSFFSALIDNTLPFIDTLMSFLSKPGMSTVTMRLSFFSCKSIGGNTNSKNSLDLSSTSLKNSFAMYLIRPIF